MKKLGLNKLREMFYEFYEGKEHFRQPSFSLIPNEDKSLLIINSGMAPLKPYFSGQKTPPAPRMVTCQKCIRTADIENVGFTSRHGTFFEMLGSFSFGDYFKEQSIKWGWEFITEILELPQDKLWVSVYVEDQEAYDIWKDIIKVPEDKIVRLGKDDNFWEIGVGPCGPCSEIYYDRGEAHGCGSSDCKPGCECDRFMEFWNHVFTQFHRDAEGNYTDLAQKNIDTGMGLERLACIMQDVDSLFAVDTIASVIHAVERLAKTHYNNGALVDTKNGVPQPSKTDISIRIITDHIRSATFMIGDKIMPSNESRGYVLRRIIRRAVRHGYMLGIKESFLAGLAAEVIETCAGAYPDLEENREFILKIINIEETKFHETLKQGLNIIESEVAKLKDSGKTVLSGETAFKLHDTFGFPIDITEEIIEESGLSVDKIGFEACMTAQKEAGKKDAAENDRAWTIDSVDFVFDGKSEFTGYSETTGTATVKAMFWDRKPLSILNEGETGNVVFDVTPFYAEGGGQISDIGLIYSDDTEAEIIDVQKFQDVIFHTVKVTKGEVNPNEEFECLVNNRHRKFTARNHTATHILHKTLREVLGEHVHQAGSRVTDTELRFDFSHYESVSNEDLMKIEALVNAQIDNFHEVTASEMSLREAVKNGIIAQFTDKYGDIVRVMTIGDYSKELCGGIHVTNTGEIGAFKIISESGIAAGVRRIEAITGRAILERLEEKENTISETCSILKVKENLLIDKVTNTTETIKELKKSLDELKLSALASSSKDILKEAKEINGISVVTKKFNGYNIDELKMISDTLKAETCNLVLIFATINEDKVNFLVSITDDIVSKGYHAGKIIKEVAKVCGGGGGGKADMAQAGGKDATKVDEALKLAEEICENVES